MKALTILATFLCTAGLLTACGPSDGSKPLTFVNRPGILIPTPEPVIAPQRISETEANQVLLVINSASSDSREIGAYYRAKRKIPKENVIIINVSTTENISTQEFNSGIKAPVQEALKNSLNPINYIVLTDGIPIRLDHDGGYSVDGHLATINSKIPAITELKRDNIERSANPYYGATTRFTSAKYNIYLVTRLIGYTVEDAKRLIDNSLAATPTKGPFFFDQAGNRKATSYGLLQSLMERSSDNLVRKGFTTTLETTDTFTAPSEPVMGYVSWGSNDGAFKPEVYKQVKFLPGALSETFVSTSGRTFKPTVGGQSLIVELIAQGVTGVKGYVSEPYTFALAQPDILFDRYVQGFNLAESFYAASPVVKWKDIVVGDPLCNPYAK
ncbi:hypothetical protein CCB80_01280 [Armatimonadetes bacterium Uphvl-Ar1]|nr:hypothetical protein CCB80_01280 [Armatimonadetes bacterium Uphvl-Ar1]